MAERTSRAKNTIESVLGPWSEGPGPLHRKLTDAVRHAIEMGYLAVGERLPSERELALRLAVSRSTVVAAYDSLRAQGLLESRQGSGTRVRPVGRRPRPDVDHQLSPVYRSLLDARDDLISLACATFPSHPLVREALHEMVAEDGDKLLLQLGYTPAGLPELREAIADMLTLKGTPTTPDQVVVTTGAQQAVNLAGALFVRPGDVVVVESPSFAGTLDAFRTRGARLACAEVIDDDGVDVDAIVAQVRTRHPSAVYVMPSFHNPTGAQMAEWRRRRLAELASTQGIPIIEDNALENAPLLDDPPLPPIAAFASPDAPVLTAGSLSKVAWGGLRVGWLRGPLPLIERIAELKAMTDLGSPLLEQAVAVRLVPRLDEIRDENTLRLRSNRELLGALLEEHLPEWEWTPPRGGPSLWVRMPSGSAAAFSQVALRYGVEIIPGESMSPASEHRDHFRFPYTAEPSVLEETVRRLTAAWRAYSPRREEPCEASPRVVV
jgi:DNA-binding transcriptional MocR family regulator